MVGESLHDLRFFLRRFRSIVATCAAPVSGCISRFQPLLRRVTATSHGEGAQYGKDASDRTGFHELAAPEFIYQLCKRRPDLHGTSFLRV